MNVVDLVVVLLMVVLALRGYRRGFVRELFSFAGWLGGGVAGVFFVYPLTPIIAESLKIPAASAGLAAFLGVFFLVSTLFWLAGWLLSAIIKATVVLRPFDRAAGLVLGAVEGVAFAAILAGVFGASPLFPDVRSRIESSFLGSRLAEQAGAFFTAVRDRATALQQQEVDRERPEEKAPPPRRRAPKRG